MLLQEFIPPIDISTLWHFPIVDFATAFLLIAILLETINLVFQRRALSVFSLLVIVMLASLMTLAYLTVGVDGKELIMSLTDSGEVGLAEYKEFGIYLAYGALSLVLLKLLFMTFTTFITRFSFAIMLISYLVLSGNHLVKGVLLKQMYSVDSQAISSLESKNNELKQKYAELEKSCAESSEDNEVSTDSKEILEDNSSLSKTNEEQNQTAKLERGFKAEFLEDVELEVEEPKVKEIIEVEIEEIIEVKEEPKEASASTISLELPSDINETH